MQCEERFFLIYSDREEFSYNNWTKSEQLRMKTGKWWSIDEIMQSDDEFFTRDIIEVLKNLTLGKIPHAPSEIA